jgi:DNA-binding MarR family transcriptional regulator
MTVPQRLAMVQQFGRTYRIFVSAFESRVGVPLPRWRIISFLHERNSPCPQRVLVETLQIDPGALTRQLKALERDGWVSRATDARDNRVTNVTLTALGVATLQEALPRREAFLNDALAALPDDLLDAFTRGLLLIEASVARSRRGTPADLPGETSS